MTNSELFYFIGKCLSLDVNQEFRKEIIQKIETESIDWQSFVELCSNHLILPVIYLKFRAHDIISYLPTELAEFLKEIHDLNQSRNEKILKQLKDVITLLNENAIYPTLLKGAGNLMDKLYTTLGERIMGDIDLLVPEKDYLLAGKLLEHDGYTMTNPSYRDIASLKHYPRLSKAGIPASVEIHRVPVNPQYSKWYNTAIIDKEKISINGDTSYFVLSDNHKVIHNFIHSQLSNRGNIYGIASLRDIYDLYLLSKRIDISQTINHIQYKRKATAYFVFAGKSLSNPFLFYPERTFSTRLFCLKHDLNLRYAFFFKTNKILRYFYERIFVGYLGQFLRSFYSKRMRLSVIKRLTNRQWYRDHLNLYITFFSRNN